MNGNIICQIALFAHRYTRILKACHTEPLGECIYAFKILGMTWAVQTKKAAARGHSSYMFVRHGITNVAGCLRQKRP